MTFTTARRIIYPIMGLLVFAVFAVSLYQVWLVNFGDEPSTYIGVPTTGSSSMPKDDNRGVFLQLLPGIDNRFPSSLVQLLETTEADVITNDQALHIPGKAILGIVINQVVIGEADEYRVYQPDATADEVMEGQKMPGGKILLLTPKGGTWPPGQHVVDVPSGGMFDTSRLYYTFVVDEEQTK